MKGYNSDISDADQALALQLLQDIFAQLTFNPADLASWLIDLKQRGKIVDTRQFNQPIEVRFNAIDYNAVSRKHNGSGLGRA